MDIVATSLEALIQRATSPSNPGTDTAAIDAFCGMVNKEPDSAYIAAKLVTTKMQSPQEWEALQSLNVLEACMKRCGSAFHAEVGKFRFLNEMIKLVSPKYLGSQTPKPVRDRVLQLMYTWTIEHPKESKIKEAYQMLRKQGVIIDDPPLDGATATTSGSSSTDIGNRSSRSSLFEDDKKQRLLQKLLQSKNPEDLQAANRLIKTMVKEDERRSEMISRKATELGAAHNNARLLSEMLDCYRPGSSSKEDLDLINELHESCERYSFQINRDMKADQTLIGDVLETVDELNGVFAKYQQVIVQGKPIWGSASIGPSTSSCSSEASNKPADSLLDLSTPGDVALPSPVGAVGSQLADLGLSSKPSPKPQTDLDALGDIFGGENLIGTSSSTFTAPSTSLLQPVSFSLPILQGNGSNSSTNNIKSVDEKPGAVKALEDLDALGASMLQQSLPAACRVGPKFNKSTTKVPMNQLGRSSSATSDTSLSHSGTPTSENPAAVSAENRDLDFLVGRSSPPPSNNRTEFHVDALLNGDDDMVDITEDNTSPASMLVVSDKPLSDDTLSSPISSKPVFSDVLLKPEMEKSSVGNTATIPEDVKTDSSSKTVEVKPLTDIFVSLDTIKPGPIPPLSALDERNGISVVLHLANDSPRSDVSVYVVSTISKNPLPLSNYVFQAVVPKTCKLRLLPASSSQLPAHNPFLPPSAMTQVMLVANPAKVPVNLKFMISYTMDDETVTEMGEVESLPMLN